MAKTEAVTAAPRVITPEAILSYPNLFTARADQKGTFKFSCALVFPEGTSLTGLKAAAIGVLVEKFGKAKAADMVKTKAVKLPFRDDAEAKGYPAGSIFINVRANQQPGIVSRIPDPKSGRPMPITDPDEVYAGCRVRASITAFWYDTEGNKGVSFGLNNIQKIGDGERLDGRRPAEDEFDADAEAAADLSDFDMPEGGAEATPEPDDDEDSAIADLLK